MFEQKWLYVNISGIKMLQNIVSELNREIKALQKRSLKIYEWKENATRMHFLCFPETTNIFS